MKTLFYHVCKFEVIKQHTFVQEINRINNYKNYTIMKKLIVLGVVLLSSAFTLTSCGKKETETEVTTETTTTETPTETVTETEVTTDTDTTAAQTTVATDTVKK